MNERNPNESTHRSTRVYDSPDGVRDKTSLLQSAANEESEDIAPPPAVKEEVKLQKPAERELVAKKPGNEKEEPSEFSEARDLGPNDYFVRKEEPDVVYKIFQRYPGNVICAEAKRVDAHTGVVIPESGRTMMYDADLIKKVELHPHLTIPEAFADDFKVKGASFPAEKLASGQIFTLGQEGGRKVYMFDSAWTNKEEFCGVGYAIDPQSGEIKTEERIAVRKDDLAAEVSPVWEIPSPWTQVPGKNILEEMEVGNYFVVKEEKIGNVFKLVKKSKNEYDAIQVRPARIIFQKKRFYLHQIAAEVVSGL